MDPKFERRIELLRKDFATYSPDGKPFEYFYCPILLRDEAVPLCRGHITNGALGDCNAWVPQRADVDNFFGSAVEADLITVVQDRRKDPAELWLDPKSRRKHKPKLVHGDKIIEHYFTPKGARPVAGQITGPLLSDTGDEICNLTLKVSEDAFPRDIEHKLSLVVEHDYRAPVIASTIKAAHLTLFKILGYQYVFSPSGLFLADILRQFYERYKPPAKCTEDEIEDYFLGFENMVAPIASDAYQGMITDNLLLSCFTASGMVFAIGVVVKASTDSFCVMVPAMSAAIDTYFSFLKEPPASIAARTTRFKPTDENGEGCWEIPPGEPMRIKLKQRFPDEPQSVQVEPVIMVSSDEFKD